MRRLFLPSCQILAFRVVVRLWAWTRENGGILETSLGGLVRSGWVVGLVRKDI